MTVIGGQGNNGHCGRQPEFPAPEVFPGQGQLGAGRAGWVRGPGRRGQHRRTRGRGQPGGRRAPTAVRTLAVRTLVVRTLGDAGPGSLRAAITAANARPASRIVFSVRGTIRLARALPAIHRRVAIDATSAPGYHGGGPPVVAINCHRHLGLVFGPGAGGSSLLGVAVDRAGDAGVTLTARDITLNHDYIGLNLQGHPAGNHGNGVLVASDVQPDRAEPGPGGQRGRQRDLGQRRRGHRAGRIRAQHGGVQPDRHEPGGHPGAGQPGRRHRPDRRGRGQRDRRHRLRRTRPPARPTTRPATRARSRRSSWCRRWATRSPATRATAC